MIVELQKWYCITFMELADIIYIYYYAEAAITLYTNKLYTHTSRIKTKLSLIE